MVGSVVRAERIGPTRFGSSDWTTGTRRVIPPSTISSNTTSAAAMPACGRAWSEPVSTLSILMARAGRNATSGFLSARPVSGAVGAPGGTVGSGLVVFGTVVVVVFGLAAGGWLPLHGA